MKCQGIEPFLQRASCDRIRSCVGSLNPELFGFLDLVRGVELMIAYVMSCQATQITFPARPLKGLLRRSAEVRLKHWIPDGLGDIMAGGIWTNACSSRPRSKGKS